MNKVMNVQMNGKIQALQTAQSLDQLLAQQQGLPDNFAIAVNQTFVPRSAYGATVLREGDQIELLVPMQGG